MAHSTEAAHQAQADGCLKALSGSAVTVCSRVQSQVLLALQQLRGASCIGWLWLISPARCKQGKACDEQ